MTWVKTVRKDAVFMAAYFNAVSVLLIVAAGGAKKTLPRGEGER